MDSILNNPRLCFIMLIVLLYFFHHQCFVNMKKEEKGKFFSILYKTQLLSVYFILIISSVYITNNLNSIDLSYVYIIIIIFVVVSLVIFHFKLDKFISGMLDKYMGNKFINAVLVIISDATLFVFLFFPQIDFIREYGLIILAVAFPLKVFNRKYL